MKIILCKEDYTLLSNFIKNPGRNSSEYTLKRLSNELKSAKVLEAEKLPIDVVRINSEVEIQEINDKTTLTVKLVIPSEADIKTNKISIFAPLSTALIGYKQGDIVEWEVPSGIKKYLIEKVIN